MLALGVQECGCQADQVLARHGSRCERAGWSALCALFRVRCFQLLTARTACLSQEGSTPLHYCAGWGIPVVCLYLLEQGADNRIRNMVRIRARCCGVKQSPEASIRVLPARRYG